MKRETTKHATDCTVAAGPGGIPRTPLQGPPPEDDKHSIQDAFDYDPGDTVGSIVKGVLAVSYLLESISEIGNKSVDGNVANGLSYVLKGYATEVDRYLKPKAREIRTIE